MHAAAVFVSAVLMTACGSHERATAASEPAPAVPRVSATANAVAAPEPEMAAGPGADGLERFIQHTCASIDPSNQESMDAFYDNLEPPDARSARMGLSASVTDEEINTALRRERAPTHVSPDWIPRLCADGEHRLFERIRDDEQSTELRDVFGGVEAYKLRSAGRFFWDGGAWRDATQLGSAIVDLRRYRAR